LADPEEAIHEYGVRLIPLTDLKPSAAVVSAVSHKQFLTWTPADMVRYMGSNPVLIDVKGMYDQQAMKAAGIRVWRL
jgi:UDP-N-acetyl-D-galactosamine dehydrogenase